MSVRTHPKTRAFAAYFTVAFVLVVLRFAWLSDDAYITLRTVDNFIHGRGLTWNVDERVQAFTHPLWMFVLSLTYAVTREHYYTVVILSVAVSAAGIWVLLGFIARGAMPALLAFLVLVLSPAYVEYSTSGLENPLTHLLIFSFASVFFEAFEVRHRLLVLAFLTSLVMLNRLDTGVLLLPALVYGWNQDRMRAPSVAKSLLPIAIGMGPLVVWELFSVVYYGFPFPNTAYAKLNIGIPAGELLGQGLFYYLSNVVHDPFTAFSIGAAMLCIPFSKDRRLLPFGIGVTLYALYTIKIGGDFMVGRFLSSMLAMSSVVLARLPANLLSPRGATLAVVVTVTLAFIGGRAPLAGAAADAAVDPRGIADERLFYAKATTLDLATRIIELPRADYHNVQRGYRVRQIGSRPEQAHAVGFLGFFAGPDAYIIDRWALTEPLLARLPSVRAVHWRIGHFERVVPDGYVETIASGRNVIRDRGVARYYDALRTIVRGPLFTWDRFVAIARMNLGQYEDLIDRDFFRHPDRVYASLAQLQVPVSTGAPVEAPGVVAFKDSGLEVTLPRVWRSRVIQLSLDSNDAYEVEYWRGGNRLGTTPVKPAYVGGLYPYRIAVPEEARRRGFDRLRVYPTRGDLVFAAAALRAAH